MPGLLLNPPTCRPMLLLYCFLLGHCAACSLPTPSRCPTTWHGGPVACTTLQARALYLGYQISASLITAYTATSANEVVYPNVAYTLRSALPYSSELLQQAFQADYNILGNQVRGLVAFRRPVNRPDMLSRMQPRISLA